MTPTPYVPRAETGEREQLPHSRARIAAEAIRQAFTAIGVGHLFPRDWPFPRVGQDGEPAVDFGSLPADSARQLAALLRDLEHPPPMRENHGAADSG